MKKVMIKFLQFSEGLLVNKYKESAISKIFKTGEDEVNLNNYIEVTEKIKKLYKKYGVREGTQIEFKFEGEHFIASLHDNCILMLSSKAKRPEITCFEDARLFRLIEIEKEDSTIWVEIP